MEGSFKKNHDNDCHGNSDDYFIGTNCGVWQFVEGLRMELELNGLDTDDSIQFMSNPLNPCSVHTYKPFTIETHFFTISSISLKFPDSKTAFGNN